MRRLTSLLLFLIICTSAVAQEVELFQSFNGRFDYLAFGNTLNNQENGPNAPCEISTQSSAELNLQPTQTVVAAYLYWAGSLDPGDLDVTLNNIPVTAERDFTLTAVLAGVELTYFAAFADVTDIILANGNGLYTLTDLDVSANLNLYCPRGTNFAGWAVTLIYEDPALNLSNVNIFDGLEFVNQEENELTIVLDNLNVIDSNGAKIGFLAWEGDSSIANGESLRLNGTLISNPPLNPANNAFNSTNSFTGADDLYNMDIDVYNVESIIDAGDTQAIIDLTSEQDFVMINNIVTVFNSEVPDATVALTEINFDPVCGNRNLEIMYTVFNQNSTAPIPVNTPIAIYANNTLLAQSQTNIAIPIGGSAIGFEAITIPSEIPADFTLRIVVDDVGNGTGIVEEISEDNNEDTAAVHLLVNPEFLVNNLEICNAVGNEIFDLNNAVTIIANTTEVSFYLTQEDAENETNPILNPEAFETESPLLPIFIRVSNPDCFLIELVSIGVTICPLPDATITLEETIDACRGRTLEFPFTVSNENGTDDLPSGTPIVFTIEGILVATAQTQNVIPIGGSEDGIVSFSLPENLPDSFTIVASVDQDINGASFVEELDETNNDFIATVNFLTIPDIPTLPTLIECDLGFDTALFNLRDQDELAISVVNGITSYYVTFEDAFAQTNQIDDPEQYSNISDPEEIFIRLENEVCFTVSSFLINTENCPPIIPQGFSPNNDGINDVFNISGLENIFENYNLKIFSRHGLLIYEGGPELGLWSGIPNSGPLHQNELVPVGTYYYVLELNDPNFTRPFLGFVYVNY